jgi:hypothetical protein
MRAAASVRRPATVFYVVNVLLFTLIGDVISRSLIPGA